MESTPIYTLRKLQSDFPQIRITSSKSASEFIRQFYCDDIGIFESMVLVTLNNDNQTTGFMKISQGGITGTVVDVRIIAKYAIDNLATGIVLAHNHPSGKLHASDADIQITKKVKEAMKLFDVQVLDHIILTETAYLSFQDEGIMPM